MTIEELMDGMYSKDAEHTFCIGEERDGGVTELTWLLASLNGRWVLDLSGSLGTLVAVELNVDCAMSLIGGILGAKDAGLDVAVAETHVMMYRAYRARDAARSVLSKARGSST